MRYCPDCGTRLPHPPPVTCGSCRSRHWRNAKPCAGALATRAGRLLLVRRAHEPWWGRFDIPGGFCEVDEHPMAAAAREVREETGLEVEVTGFLGMWVDDYPDPEAPAERDEDRAVTLNAYYHAAVVGGEERPEPGEVAELGWFGPGELPEEVAFPRHANQVLAAWRRAVEAGLTESPLLDRP